MGRGLQRACRFIILRPRKMRPPSPRCFPVNYAIPRKRRLWRRRKDVNRHSGPGGKPGGAWWNPPGSVIPENSSCLFATGILLFWKAPVNVLLRSAALAYFRIFQSFRKADYLFLPGNFSELSEIIKKRCCYPLSESSTVRNKLPPSIE